MKITNKYGLPEAIVNAVRNDSYSRGASDISVTQLISPPQLVELARAHDSEIEEDASDRLWSLMGQAMHAILERAHDSAIKEKRLFTEVGGWIVSGQFDRLHLESGVLQDYKFASVWESIFGLKSEREQQLNLLALLARRAGYAIEKLAAVMLFRDWSASKAKLGDDYPKRQIEIIPVALWSPEKQDAFLAERVRLHKAARADGAIQPCSDDERWAKPRKWAVTLPNRKSALRVFDNLEAAQALAEATKNALIVYRPGEQTRCERYCPVADFCPQWAELKDPEGRMRC